MAERRGVVGLKQSHATSLMRKEFDQHAFLRLLRSNQLGRRLDFHPRIPSTMRIANELLTAEGSRASHGAIVLTDEQTAGLGRRGRSWEGEGRSSLLFSLVWATSSTELDMAGAMKEMVRLNMAAPIAVVNACCATGVSGAKIKWPNDIWGGSPPLKLSGVLLDFNGRDAAVLGVGINVLQHFEQNKSATSVATLLRRTSDGEEHLDGLRERLLASFCVELERLMALPNEAVIAEHRAHDLLEGQNVRVHHRSREEADPRDFEAHVLGVDGGGWLRVRPVGQSEVRTLSGEEISITPMLA